METSNHSGNELMEKSPRKKNQKTLWQRFQSGDEDAFFEIYQENHALLFNYAIRLSSNEELSRDCIHDMYLELWEKKGKLKSLENFKPYLFKFLRNIVIDKIKEHHKLIGESNGKEPDMVISHEDFLIGKEYKELHVQKVTQALQSLSPRQKEVVYLKFYSNLSYKEIAEVYQINYQSVRNLMSESLKKMKELLLFLVFVLIFWC
ncbi:RNA polymerase sigma factor [Flexithrix dorotheae]|uniref:RNA polymerase sigma factor n=1 Tax=Flexithrix dorotheae TaxID=70993 RepID=UPI0005C603AA|nr:sigma-70 family RNA polymerase sigma factor [Flexithrix dorotheae]